ncbi:MAG: hemerythrin domain-containing protein [Pseudomonadota bacterium]
MSEEMVKQWQDKSNAELVEFIVERYHQRHRVQIPELKQLALKIEQVHGDHPQVPAGLSEHLDSMLHELESHMMKEEQILFPMLVRGIYPSGPISVMEEEHVQHDQELQHIIAITNDLTAPDGACGSWQELYRGLKELINDLNDHIELENTVLFVDSNNVPEHGQDFCCGSCQ